MKCFSYYYGSFNSYPYGYTLNTPFVDLCLDEK